MSGGDVEDDDNKGFWDRAREAKRNSDGIVSYFITMVSITSVTIIGTCCIITAAVIPFVAVVIGIIKFDQCPANSMIPVYLIVVGVLGMISSFLSMTQQVMDDEKKKKCLGCLQCPVSFIWLGFFIAGNFWVFGAYAKVDTSHKLKAGTANPNFCDPWVYWFAFALIVSVYAFLFLACFLCCVLVFALGRTTHEEETPIVDIEANKESKQPPGGEASTSKE